MSRTFHHDMMQRLDGATYRGRQIPPREHHAMRQALRKANMRGAPIMTPKALAQATLAELSRRQD
jgi:uncharacterized membrane protein